MISQAYIQHLNNATTMYELTRDCYGRLEDIMIEAERRLSEHEYAGDYAHPDIEGWVYFDRWEELPSDLLQELTDDVVEGRI